MYAQPNLQLKAGGNIPPSHIVKLSTAADNTVLVSAAATSVNIGVAQGGTRRAPGTGDDDGYAAIAGENVAVFGPGSGQALVDLGGTVTRGDAVTSDGNGRGVSTTTDGDIIIGWAMQSGVSRDLVTVLINPGYLYIA